MSAQIKYDGNKKLGKMLTVSWAKQTCPDTCMLKYRIDEHGIRHPGPCYANNEFLFSNWADIKDDITTYTRALRAIDTYQGDICRISEKGDLPGKGNRLNLVRFFDLIRVLARRAARNQKSILYTHKTQKRHWRHYKTAQELGVTINLSADNITQADKLVESGLPVVTVLPIGTRKTHYSPAGNKVIVCPHDTHGVQCITCRLCALPRRDFIVGFPAHGNRKKQADLIAKSA